MTAINFKLSELRKRRGLTQQELGEALGVSHQNISKWENNVTMPDISLLPAISEYFNVSVDAVLGLVPLSEEYQPSRAGEKEYWADRIDYLLQSRNAFWNEDYMKFLIRDVWKINKPVNVLDCGCGYGYLGLLLLPILPQGSTYTGIDFSEEMLDTGKKLFAKAGLKARFICEDIFQMKLSAKYDLVISQATLRHVNNGEVFLKKMIHFAKENGLVVSMECNREFEEDGLYIVGMEYADLCKHAGFEKLWKTEYEMQKRDYSIAMKVPHYMEVYGLRNIDVRMNDRVTYLEPEQENYEKILSKIIKEKEWDQVQIKEEQEAGIEFFMNHGMSRKEAEDYLEKRSKITQFIKENDGKISLTKCGGIMISYGWK